MKRAICTVALLLFAGVMLGQANRERWTFKDAEARAAVKQFDTKLQKLRAQFDEQAARLSQQLVQVLESRRDAATRAGNLEEALRLRYAVQQLLETKPSAQPPEPAEPVIEIEIHRAGDEGPRSIEELNDQLAGTTWMIVEGEFGDEGWVRFNPDHTLQVGWDKYRGIWAAVDGNVIKATMWENRNTHADITVAADAQTAHFTHGSRRQLLRVE